MIPGGPSQPPTGLIAGRMETRRLDSWKEIASFFKREVRTVQLWERHEGLPVHRHRHRKLGTVHAYQAELETWWKQRCSSRAANSEPTKPIVPDVANTRPALRSHVTLAVLPFKSFSSNPADQGVVDGLTEQITIRLDRFMPRRLRVTSSLAVAQRHAEGLRLHEVNGELDVDYLLHGGVQASLGRVRISAQLVRVKDRSNIWSNTFDYVCSDLLDIHADVAEQLSRALFHHVLMSRQEIKSDTVNPAARYAYLRGRYLWNWRTSPEAMFNAMDQFRLAIELDPNHARAYSGLADCYAVLGWLDAIPRKPAVEGAREAALKALALDGMLSEAHVSLGYVLFDYDWDWEGAEKELLLGIELNPANAQGYCWYGHVLQALGRNQEAVNAAQTAQDMDPASPVVNLFLGSALFHASQYDEAIQQFQHVLSMRPDYAFAQCWLGLAYEQTGQLQSAISQLQAAAGVRVEDRNVQAMLAHAHARAGDHRQAGKLLQHLQLGEGKQATPTLDVAAAFTALGDNDTAMRYLYMGFDQRNARLTKLKCDPRLIPLHADPRFESLARRMRLP
jgi:TolB-like protein/tetratricopeptide (TPR) repeat protein